MRNVMATDPGNFIWKIPIFILYCILLLKFVAKNNALIDKVGQMSITHCKEYAFELFLTVAK